MADRERRVALLALGLATAIWGATFFITRAGMLATMEALERSAPGSGPFGPMLFLVLRFALAAGAAALLPGALRGLSGRRAWTDTLAVSAPFFAGFLLQNYGLVATTATVSAFLTSVYVVIVPAIVVVARRIVPSRRLIASALLVLAGIAILTRAGAGGGRGPGFGRGELLSLLSAFAFAYQVYLIDRFARRTSPAALTFGTMVVTALAGLVLLTAFPEGRTTLSARSLSYISAEPAVLLALGFSALLASVLAMYLVYRFQNVVSPSRAAIVYAAEPAFAAAFATGLGTEAFGLAALSGSFLILMGNVVAELPPR